ncbi:family 20 glycosylhydrolase [Trueperella pecoris]|uniref:Family 20 glycosylhydrolase n=1 Tax=Trueperella pecoris TaxID=2733571 RepID=A0A7M1R3K5_9ACTO|nr:family 20 glycosylhydrolase [Trueperella pecoris]QOR48045.1 family 20 glycosylhydrolase [Trueperella pecoris]
MSTHRKLLGGALAMVLTTATLAAAPGAVAAPIQSGGIHDVIPAVRHFEPAGGDAWMLTPETKIVAPETLKADAEKLALDLAVKGNVRPKVEIGGVVDADDIELKVDANLDVPQKDGYVIKSSKDALTITGKSVDGAFWGQQTVVQSVASAGGVQAGNVRDWADVGERSFHQDMARKYYDKDYILNLIHQMSYRKLNALQLHFSENEGFRLESKQHPEVMSKDGVITQDQLKVILAEAKKYHVEVIPALDMPGHMRQALSEHPELRLKGYGDEARKGLDFSKPEAVEFVKSLVDEFAPLFPDTNKWHLGADEYVHPFRDADWKYSETTERVKAKLGQDKRFVDGFVAFINEMANYLKTKHNKDDVRVWNDAFYLSNSNQKVELSKDITIDYWTKWDAPMAPVKTFVDKGYKLINYNDAYMYWVLAEPDKAYYDKPSAEKIFNGFHAGRFPSINKYTPQAWPTENVKRGETTEYPDWLRGASFAIWSDAPHMFTQDEVAENTKGPYTAFADRVWYSGDERTFDQFKASMKAVGDAPVVPADLDKVVVATESKLESTPASGETVTPGQDVAYTASVKNASSQAVPVKVAALSTNLVTEPGNVPVTLLGADGKPVAAAGKNVALKSEGTKATASSVEANTNFTADKAIDGDATNKQSRWSSMGGRDGESITLEFAKPQDLVKLRLAWEGAHATAYTVTYSHPEGPDTQDKFTYSGSEGKDAAWIEHVVNQKAVTKMTLKGTARSLQDYGISLFELEAYSAGGPVKAPDAELGNVGNLQWSGTLEPEQSIAFSWDGTVKEDASADVTTQLVSTAIHALKPITPSVAKSELKLKAPEPQKVEVKAPTFDDTKYTVTLPEKMDGVTYLLDGEPADGGETVTFDAGETVTVTAQPTDPEKFALTFAEGYDEKGVFTHTFPRAPTTDPTTPGTDPTTPGTGSDEGKVVPPYENSADLEKAIADHKITVMNEYTAKQGESVKATFDKLAAGKKAHVYFYSMPKDLGEATVDDKGSLTFTVKVAKDETLGVHYALAAVAGEKPGLVKITVDADDAITVIDKSKDSDKPSDKPGDKSGDSGKTATSPSAKAPVSKQLSNTGSSVAVLGLVALGLLGAGAVMRMRRDSFAMSE